MSKFKLLEVVEEKGKLYGQFIKELNHDNNVSAGNELKELYPLCVEDGKVVNASVLCGKEIFGVSHEGTFIPSAETTAYIGKSEKGLVFTVLYDASKYCVCTSDGEEIPIELR